MKYKKIRVLGGSGSGKTYLAKKLHKLTGLAIMYLDEVTYDVSKPFAFKQPPRTLEERNKIHDAFTKKHKKWIIEGNYYTWKKDTYDKADILIFIKKPLIIRIKNVTKRFFQRLNTKERESVLSFIDLLKYNLGEGRRKLKTRQQQLEKEYGDKLHVFSSADEAYEWFKN